MYSNSNESLHSQSFIRVELPVHGQGEPEQAARLPVLPDDMTGVQVEGEHQSCLQKIGIK